jgi:hypothetical protein
MPDLFVSYARSDNASGEISAFVEAIERAFARLVCRELDTFFDRKSITHVDDWRERILGGLRQSAVLLTCITTACLASG